MKEHREIMNKLKDTQLYIEKIEKTVDQIFKYLTPSSEISEHGINTYYNNDDNTILIIRKIYGPDTYPHWGDCESEPEDVLIRDYRFIVNKNVFELTKEDLKRHCQIYVNTKRVKNITDEIMELVKEKENIHRSLDNSEIKNSGIKGV